MHGSVFREPYSIPLHKNLLTRDQQSFPTVFRMVMWPINSEIYFLTIPRAFYLPWEMRTLWSQKCNYFTYLCKLSWRKSWNPEKKMIESEYKRFLWDCLIQSSAGRVSRIQGIKWMSRHFAENWRWHSSLDRVGRGWEFQQITELWIRIVYLRAKCQKRLSVIRKKQRRIKKTSKTYMWQFVNRRAHQRWNIALHATTKRTSASKSLKFTYSSQHMKHKIVPSSLLLKLLYNLPYQRNVSTSIGQNLSPTFSVPPWL